MPIHHRQSRRLNHRLGLAGLLIAHLKHACLQIDSNTTLLKTDFDALLFGGIDQRDIQVGPRN